MTEQQDAPYRLYSDGARNNQEGLPAGNEHISDIAERYSMFEAEAVLSPAEQRRINKAAEELQIAFDTNVPDIVLAEPPLLDASFPALRPGEAIPLPPRTD